MGCRIFSYYQSKPALNESCKIFVNGQEKTVSTPKNCKDYYPFGMIMPGGADNNGDGDFYDEGDRRLNFSGASYRYGFNGMEKEDDMTANHYDFGARIYDGRIGRWLAVDPEWYLYTSISDYSFALDNPIFYIDYDGGIVKDKNGKLITEADLKSGDLSKFSFGDNGFTKGLVLMLYNSTDVSKDAILAAINSTKSFTFANDEVNPKPEIDKGAKAATTPPGNSKKVVVNLNYSKEHNKWSADSRWKGLNNIDEDDAQAMSKILVTVHEINHKTNWVAIIFEIPGNEQDSYEKAAYAEIIQNVVEFKAVSSFIDQIAKTDPEKAEKYKKAVLTPFVDRMQHMLTKVGSDKKPMDVIKSIGLDFNGNVGQFQAMVEFIESGKRPHWKDPNKKEDGMMSKLELKTAKKSAAKEGYVDQPAQNGTTAPVK